MEKDYVCLAGESDMGDFTAWWESHLPSYLIIYCRQGEAEMQMMFEKYAINKGHLTIITPDMFPAFTSRSADFRAFYCLMNRDFAEYTAYGVPNKFFDCQFSCPVIFGGQDLDSWTRLLEHAATQYDGYQCSKEIVKNIIHDIYLVYFNLWQQQYGDTKQGSHTKG